MSCLLLLVAAAAFVSGCSNGNSSGTKAGAIAIAYPVGATANQFPALDTATLSMTAANDKASLGVDWSLICGGSPLAPPVLGGTTSGCGTLLPSHTPNGVAATYTAPALIPVGNTVTITARVTSDASQSSSVAFNIVSLPISITLSPPPASLAVSGTTTLTALLTNDQTAAGATWTATCGSSDCGSFSASQTFTGGQTTYTAPASPPANGSVTITVASVAYPAASISATVSILPITVSVAPASLNVATSGTAKFTATVAHDTKNAGVTWSCAPAGCGSFSPATTLSGGATTYTAPAMVPAGGKVTITATSVTDPTASKSATALVSSGPVITVAMTRTLAASLGQGRTAILSATVTGDSTNAGVDWTAVCGGTSSPACGTFNPAHTASGSTTTYTAPATPPASNPVTITATSHAANLNPSLVTNSASATTTITAPSLIAFVQQPPATVMTQDQVQVSASVANDATPGGVNWSVQCSNTAAGACGYILPRSTADGVPATYYAPPVLPGVPVKIQAQSVSSPALAVSSSSMTVVTSTVHTISIVPFAPAQMQPGTTVGLNAAVANDPTNSGVDWQVCASGCGFFTIRPLIPAIPVVPPSSGDPGSPYVPEVPAVTATSVQGWPSGLPISYTAPVLEPAGGMVTVSAAAAVDRLQGAAYPAIVASSIAVNGTLTGPALHGVVQAGTQPLVGASVYLYTAGTGGYGSASVPVNSPQATGPAVSDANGNFAIPEGYACPGPTSQAYLLATGGQVGTGDPNPNLVLMTALGPCSNLSSTPVVVNEVTTVVSATALAPFTVDGPVTGMSMALNIGSSGTNAASGLANAFATVNNLVDITTGRPRFYTLAGNASVPYVEINTFADAIDACAVTSGGSMGDSSSCGNLFTYADPIGLYAPSVPTDTLQAVFELLKPTDPTVSPSSQLSAVFTLVTTSSPFQPVLTAAPHDWSISLNYTSGGGVGGAGTAASGSSAFAIDTVGNLWIANKNTNSVSEWSSLGAAISPSATTNSPGGFTPNGVTAPSLISIDVNGYVWTVNGNNSLVKLDSTGAVFAGPFLGGGLTNPSGMAIDKTGNIWITNSGSPGDVAEFSSRGLVLSPQSGYINGVSNPLAIAVDGTNNIWFQNRNSLGASPIQLMEWSNAGASPLFSANYNPNGLQQQIAIDASGNIWEPQIPCGVFEMSASYAAGIGSSPYPVGFPNSLANPQGMAVDGASRPWLASPGGIGCNSAAFAPNITLVDTPNGYSLNAPSLSNGPQSMAVDNAGNIWVLLGNNSLTEFVGVANPVVTPLALGVKNNKLGSKP